MELGIILNITINIEMSPYRMLQKGHFLTLHSVPRLPNMEMNSLFLVNNG